MASLIKHPPIDISHMVSIKAKHIFTWKEKKTDDYVRDISSSDITSSSESEYEEMDINDIYKPLGPKYKTLIEVVLKPSKSTQDTHITPDISDTQNNTPTYQNNDSNKLTDNEWNQLKQDFILNMLQNG
ncbi:erythrocyte membrane protein 1 (PfEMP1), putative [Plasmodium gaboni]|uniref:Erythrocyte membrane protein 1 (PfEMP1), putative n=1 Tax=Plasmodium gaboni TaxID=647221 RepID=A0ABY0KW81_9APIC|nr:erythrocyte membrane protein 1 (PfEMP1), putative [Plasmodium gaboni]